MCVCDIYKYICAEPPKKKQKPNQSSFRGIISEEIKTMINAWKLQKHHQLFNVLPTEVKENLDTENLSCEPTNMQPETATSENKGIMEFWYTYCMDGNKDGWYQEMVSR